jgi:glycosyltransferase involved in cell wall biosynthesis
VGATVSVIIAAFNAEKYIAEALESVLAQTYPEVECIVVDDGSTDRTAEIVKGFGTRIQYRYQENAERSAARNNGVAHASGQFISFLDADDILLPDKLAEQVAFFDANPPYDAVYSLVTYFQDNGKRRWYTVKRATPFGDITSSLLYGNFITMNSPLFRKSAVDRVAGFDVSFSRYEDWDFLLRLSLSGSRFGFLDATHALCRVHGENTVQDAPRMFEAKLSVARKIASRFGNELLSRGIDGNSVVAFHRADYGRKLILAGRVEEGGKAIHEACENIFPHRRKFKVFSLASRLFGYRFLAIVQKSSDCLLKYRKALSGNE